MVIDAASDADTLTTCDLDGLPVDTTIAFSDHKGVYKPRIEKQQRKLLKNLAFLPPFLEHDEKILFAATGCSPTSFLEQFLTGAIIYRLKRCLLVFTDRRVLHIPTRSNFTYRKSIAHILYADCLHLRVKRATLVAKYKSGRSDKFMRIPRLARKKLKELLKGISFEGQTSQMLERTHLCPRCARPLINDYYACPHCSLEFKNKAKARAMSVLLPGGGYFYTRNIALGIMDALAETLFSVVLVAAVVEFLRGGLSSPHTLGQTVGACVVVLVVEKITSILHASRFVEEFIPIDLKVTVQPELTPAKSHSPNPEEALCTGWRSV